jgi:hypothetical protein
MAILEDPAQLLAHMESAVKDAGMKLVIVYEKGSGFLNSIDHKEGWFDCRIIPTPQSSSYIRGRGYTMRAAIEDALTELARDLIRRAGNQ